MGEALSAVWAGATGLAGRAKSGAAEARKQVGAKAGEAASALADEATRLIDQQKERAADRIDGVASAAHQTARVLRAARLERIGDMVDGTAEAMDDFTRYLEEGDVRQILSDTADLARRHPGAAAAGALVVGLLIGRFIAAGQQGEDVTSGGEKPRGGSAKRSRGRTNGAAKHAANGKAHARAGR